MRRPVVLLAALLLPLVPGSPATAAPAVCEPGPVELVGGGPQQLVAGRDHVQGYVLRRLTGGGTSCVVPGAAVELLARDAGAATARVVRTGRTDEAGRVQFRVRPPFSVVLQARTADVQSAPTTYEVGTRLTLAARGAGDCRVAVSGSTYPAKPGTAVLVRREVSRVESSPAGRLAVRSDGTYAGTLTVPCGATPRMAASVQQTARNAPGDTDRRLVVAARTTTCGTALRSEGAVSTLTHSFEPFNTTTAVGGSWWGERVVSNRTSEPQAFDVYTTDVHQLVRRGSTVLLGSNGFSDAIGVRRAELAPGAELRERVELPARNCFEEPPPGSAVLASLPGPAFPAGTALVGQTVLATGAGRSVSQRVALTVG
ncbi:MAG: hypothetical protein JWN08_1280 [Frankiales bacterium]|nr:hypothetical protein [Frankiales bacterium]